MIKIAIVEDNTAEAIRTKSFLLRYAKENGLHFEIWMHGDAESFLAAYQKDCNLILMDIELPGLNGMEACKRIRAFDQRVVIVFLTNMAQFAINGYAVDALDFVLKPITYPDLVLKMEKVRRFLSSTAEKITIKHKDGVVCVEEDEIYFVEVIKHYLVYHTVRGDYTARGPMKALEAACSSKFARAGHSFIVNLRYIAEINGDMIIMEDGAQSTIKITRSHNTSFLKAFSAYMGGIR